VEHRVGIIVAFILWGLFFILMGIVSGAGLVGYINSQFGYNIYVEMASLLGGMAGTFFVVLACFGLLPGLRRLGVLPAEFGLLRGLWILIGFFLVVDFLKTAVSNIFAIHYFVFILEHTSTSARWIGLNPSLLSGKAPFATIMVALVGAGAWTAWMLRETTLGRLIDGGSANIALGKPEHNGYLAASIAASMVLFLIVIEQFIIHHGIVAEKVSTLGYYWNGDLLAVTIISIFFVPIYEEIIFRGASFAALRPRLGLAGASLLTTVCFVTYHESFSVTLLLNTALLGLTNCWLRIKYRSIRPGVILHMFYNMSVVIIGQIG